MVLTEVQRAILDLLSDSAPPRQTRWGPGGWVVGVGGGWGADPATVRFLKSKAGEGWDLHAVAFTTTGGQPRRAILRARFEPAGGWRVQTIGGGGDGGPHRERPWVNFTANSGPHEFRAGGQVVGDGADRAATVRITFPDGTVEEDRVDSGTVSFSLERGMNFPAEVEMLDDTGATLSRYTEFQIFA